MVSNYEKTKDRMRSAFLEYDHSKIADHFGLDRDGEYLCFGFLGAPCRVSVRTGIVECFDMCGREFREADYDETMTVYDLLCRSGPEAVPSGEFVNMNSLSQLTGAASAPSPKNLFSRQAREFDNKVSELSEALRSIGGKITAGASAGDLSAEFDVFCGLKLIFRFWNSDEDFDAQIQLFWDKNVLKYMHYETVWYAGGVLLHRLESAAGNTVFKTE